MSKTRRLWRLIKSQYVSSAFDGEGAFRFGGRWNSRGQRVVYASGSLSLAVLEVLVHVDPAGHLPELSAIPIDVPVEAIAERDFSSIAALSGGLPWSLRATRAWGDTWTRDQLSAALQVPSAIVPNECNFLLNPQHPSFERCRIGEPEVFPMDTRLVPS